MKRFRRLLLLFSEVEMNYLHEREIRDAVRSGDGKALEDAINNIPRHSRDFEDVQKIVQDAGGWKHLKMDKIEMDGTVITEDRSGKAVVNGSNGCNS
jgi:hypothetical protein